MFKILGEFIWREVGVMLEIVENGCSSKINLPIRRVDTGLFNCLSYNSRVHKKDEVT